MGSGQVFHLREVENAVIPLEKKPEQDAPPTLRDKEGYLQILIP